MNARLLMVLVVVVVGLSCSKVCEQQPLSGEWAQHAELIPAEATTCGATGGSLRLGFEGKSGPTGFRLMTEHIEKLGGWKVVRSGS